MAQKEITPEDSKRAAGYYRNVCLPAWVSKWDALIDEIDARYDWLDAEAIRIKEQENATRDNLLGES